MSFLTKQDWTPKFAGHDQLDRTESGLIFLTFYLTSIGYQFSLAKIPGLKFVVKSSKLGSIEKKKLENKFFGIFFLFLKVLKVRCPGRKTSSFRTVQILKICRISGPDMMSSRALNSVHLVVD